MTFHAGDVLASQKFISGEWIPDFENGKIYKRNHTEITGAVMEDGYLQIGSRDADGDMHRVLVHRALMIMFHKGKIPPSFLQVDHINGNKQDNRIENLRFCTPKENCNNPNTKVVGDNHPRRKVSDAQRREIVREKMQGISNAKLAAKYGCCRQNISRIMRVMRKHGYYPENLEKN